MTFGRVGDALIGLFVGVEGGAFTLRDVSDLCGWVKMKTHQDKGRQEGLDLT